MAGQNQLIVTLIIAQERVCEGGPPQVIALWVLTQAIRDSIAHMLRMDKEKSFQKAVVEAWPDVKVWRMGRDVMKA